MDISLVWGRNEGSKGLFRMIGQPASFCEDTNSKPAAVMGWPIMEDSKASVLQSKPAYFLGCFAITSFAILS
jgi:hypothetical protein